MTARAMRDILIGGALLMLLCVVAGRPQVFSDTRAYHALGAEAARLLTPGDASTAPAPPAGVTAGAAQADAATRLAYTVAASRSPYWSVLFYLAVQIGTAWLVVALQAGTAATVIWIAARAFGVGRAYLPIMAVLALLTSLPVQVMFLMPDLFAGLMILAAATLLAARDRLARWEAIALWLVLAASTLFHSSHLLILIGLGAATFALGIARRGQSDLRPVGGAMLGAAAIGAVGAVAFPLAVQAIRNQPVYAPPFVAARLIADGPGQRLLDADCPAGAGWAWCPYRDRPLDDVNTILWDTDPADASFQAADYARRVAIIREQPAFALAVVTRYPVEVAAAGVSNIVRLFFQFGSGEALDDPTSRYREAKFAVFRRIVPGTDACANGTASCAPRISIAVLDTVVGATLLASWIAVLLLLIRVRARPPWGRAAIVVIAGLSLNAIICGGISGNAQRYQSRVTWLMPLLAAAMAAEALARRERRAAGSAA